MSSELIDVSKRVSELRVVQSDWESLGVTGRVRWVRRYANWLLDNADLLTELLVAECGKPLVEAKVEVTVPIDIIKYYCRQAEKSLRTRHPAPPNLLNAVKRVDVVHRPYPVVAVITPWNFPLGLSLLDAIPALLAGAAVVVKPAPATPHTVVAAVEGWAEIGAPAVFTVIAGDDDAGRALVDEADYVQFTGSTATGRKIAQRCAERLIPCGLELGGKDPAIVLADADVELAAHGIAWGALINAGQMCTSVERVYVVDPIYDSFVETLAGHVRSLRRDLDVSSLVTAEQFEVVSRHLADATASGARVLAGGGTEPAERWVEPTVLVDVDHTMTCLREETFGPLIPVVRVGDESEAVRLANATTYGLSASVWSRDIRHAERVAAQLDVGAVNINDVHANLFFFAAPMAGWKESGLGSRLGGADGIVKYCRPQTVTKPRAPLPLQRLLLWYPYTDFRTNLLGRTLRALAATGRRRFRS
ncbi:aldehyde dehydrogenase family protein [Nocardia sp. NPDC049190]|uniref:aldehyde dehydrogenase family protein n=1 Tax=Nocardia sp. NPDC049190 TaxID=3155650 RepID=UPI00340AB587